jgi:hypothetical protein
MDWVAMAIRFPSSVLAKVVGHIVITAGKRRTQRTRQTGDDDGNWFREACSGEARRASLEPLWLRFERLLDLRPDQGEGGCEGRVYIQMCRIKQVRVRPRAEADFRRRERLPGTSSSEIYRQSYVLKLAVAVNSLETKL